jgi:hypothetical protein
MFLAYNHGEDWQSACCARSNVTGLMALVHLLATRDTRRRITCRGQPLSSRHAIICSMNSPTLHAKALASNGLQNRRPSPSRRPPSSTTVLAPARRQDHCEEMEEKENVNKFPRSLEFSIQNIVLFMQPPPNRKLTPANDVGTSHHNQIK